MLESLTKTDIQIRPFWSLDESKTLETLGTRPEGLSADDYKAAWKKFGPNRLRAKSRLSVWSVLLNQFKNPLIFILLLAGGLTLFLKVWIDAAVIFLAIGVNTALGFYQESKAENALEKLRSYIHERARVLRSGREHEIDAEKLVPGDIIHLAYGTRVPADARLLSINNFSTDEALLTGESLPVNKRLEPLSEATSIPDRLNMVFGGTLVAGGYATAVVTATGHETEIGKIADLVSRAGRERTPLQKAVWKLAWLIAAVMAVVISGIFILGLYRGESLVDMFLISTAVAVGAIPEALPIVLTVILAVGVEELAKRKGVMRNLGAAETLGSTTLIITDKTGTLTEAKMKLVDIFTAADLLNGKQSNNQPTKNLSSEQKAILTTAFLNTDVLVENPEEPETKWQLSGRPLETNIFQSLLEHGLDPLKLREEKNSRLILPFNSQNRFSVYRHEERLVYLGAPDTLLKKAKISKEDYLQITETFERLSREGKRLLGLAVRKISNEKELKDFDPDSTVNLEFVGLLAFYDPVRESVPKAMKKLEAANVKVVIATGDLPGTARAVAEELGWQVDDGQILTGEELARLSDEELLSNLGNIKIFARVTPEDKLRIGKLYQRQGEVVGMTGDGVNDAPSLKAVDIGIAVGSGSDVAKEVADLVILDDNFETIVIAMEEGYRILSNIKKGFVYLISNALDEVILIGGSLLLALPLPLTTLQIIWVNFFTGSFPALSFAFDDFLDRKHLHRLSSKKILDNEVKFLSLGIGFVTSALLFGLYWYLSSAGFDEARVKTFIFACFASYILFAAFSFRSLKKPIFTYPVFGNKFLNLSVALGLVLIALTIYLPFGQKVFATTPLSAVWLAALAGWVVVNILLVEGAKWLYRKS